VTADWMERLGRIASIVGVVPEACDHIAAQYARENQRDGR